MERHAQFMAFGAALFLGAASIAQAQYGGATHVRTPAAPTEQLRTAAQTLLVQVDHLVEDMEMDLQRDPASERLMTLAYDVQDEVEHLAASIERGADVHHVVRDFQQFDGLWHRLSRQAQREAGEDRHMQRNLARMSQTDAEIHRLLRVPTPVDVQEVRGLTSGLRHASNYLRSEIETDLRGLWQQREILERAAALEEASEHLERSVARGVDVQHMREDFAAVDEAWLSLAQSLRRLSPMRFDHVLRATNLVATNEGQLKAALGLEPNPEQFTCFRPDPSETRSSLPYASNGRPVTLPSGWRLVPTTPVATQTSTNPYRPTPPPPIAVQPGDPGLGLFLGLLFGGNSSGENRARSPRGPESDEDDDDSHPHEHEHERVTRPTKTGPVSTRTEPAAPAVVPAKPIDSVMQAKLDKQLAKLSPKDRAAAMAQRTCPVSGDLLGSHGMPIKVTVKDDSGVRRDIFVCCDDCEEELDDHPRKYLHKLDR